MARAVKYDTFLHHEHELKDAKTVVTLVYQAYCDPCRSSKHHIEALAKQYGFFLIRVDGAFSWDPEMAGQITPAIQVYVDGKAKPALVGAHPRAKILDYLVRHGVVTL